MMRLLLTTWLGLTAAAHAAGPQWIVVVAPEHREAVDPLVRHRKEGGFSVAVVEPAGRDAGDLRDEVARLCRGHDGPSFVLLVGAVEPGTLNAPGRKVVPASRGTVGRMTGQPTDNAYGLTGADLKPTVAVGRFPARTAAEAKAMAAKTVALETDASPGDWRRRLTVLAGAPEYNPVVDSVVERLAITQLARIDPSWHGRALYHNPQSRFTLPDALVHGRARKYVEEGQAVTLYLGHSNAEGFWANDRRYLDRDDWAELTIRRGKGVFATFGCFGCQLAGKNGEGYGVAAARNAGGPAAVVGSHGECYAAMVKLASEAFTNRLLGPKPPERLGDAWLALLDGLARGKIDPVTYRLLDSVDGDSKVPQATQRKEHLEMFTLLGDPALRLPTLPADLSVKHDGDVRAGGRLRVTGKAPARLEGAEVRVTLDRPVDSDPAPAEKTADAVDRHDRANQFTVARASTKIVKGEYEVELTLPSALPWRRLTLRTYAATAKEEGMGVLRVEASEPRP